MTTGKVPRARALIALGMAFGCALLVAGCDGGSDPPTNPTHIPSPGTSFPGPPVTTEANATTTTEPIDWGLWTPASGVALVYPMVHTGVEFVGIEGSNFVSSIDGVSWEVRGSLSSDVVLPSKIVLSDSTILVLGDSPLGDPGLPIYERQVEQGLWLSFDDGYTWEWSVLDRWFRDVIAYGDGFLAVGNDREGIHDRSDSYNGTMWTSEDGRVWEVLAVAEDLDRSMTDMRIVVLHGDELIIFGSGQDRRHRNLVWRYNGEGLGSPEEFNASESIVVLLSRGDRLVAVGDKKAWTSNDGVNWDLVDVGQSRWGFSTAAVVEDSVLLLGFRRGEGLYAPIEMFGVWTSGSRSNWRLVEVPFNGHQLAVSDDVVVVSGFSRYEDLLTAARNWNH